VLESGLNGSCRWARRGWCGVDSSTGSVWWKSQLAGLVAGQGLAVRPPRHAPLWPVGDWREGSPGTQTYLKSNGLSRQFWRRQSPYRASGPISRIRGSNQRDRRKCSVGTTDWCRIFSCEPKRSGQLEPKLNVGSRMGALDRPCGNDR
jgi:hypothetical protein